MKSAAGRVRLGLGLLGSADPGQWLERWENRVSLSFSPVKKQRLSHAMTNSSLVAPLFWGRLVRLRTYLVVSAPYVAKQTVTWARTELRVASPTNAMRSLIVTA